MLTVARSVGVLFEQAHPSLMPVGFVIPPMTVAGRAGVDVVVPRLDRGWREVSMTVATWSIEAIDNALTEACADPYENPQTQADRIDYLLDRRLQVMHG